MIEEIETSIKTREGERVSVDSYDDGVWLSIQSRRAGMSAVLSRAEAEQMIANLQAVLARESA